MSCLRFEGRVALVTSGGGGIGSATATRLAEEGAAVAVTDVNVAAAQTEVTRLEQYILSLRESRGQTDDTPQPPTKTEQ